MTSCSSSTASSTPATSRNVIFGESTDMRFARALPKLITLEPPPCIWFIRKIQIRKMNTNGASASRTLHQVDPPVALTSWSIFVLRASLDLLIAVWISGKSCST